MSMVAAPWNEKIIGIILAAGKGTRMKSATPKVLHRVAGLPMVEWVRAALSGAGIKQHCLVLSEDLVGFEDYLQDDSMMTVGIQRNRLGTGDAVAAVACCFAEVESPPFAAGHLLKGDVLQSDYVIVCAGDVPCVAAESYERFVAGCLANQAKLGVLGMEVSDPKGYGRLVRDSSGNLLKVVEEKDADEATKAITICNTGIIFAQTKVLFSLLSRINNQNAAGEYYLPDCFGLARQDGLAVHVHVGDDYREFGGVNNRLQLSQAEQLLMTRRREEMMLNGVTIHTPESVFVEKTVEVAPDCELDPQVNLLGATSVGSGSRIGAGSYLQNVEVKAGTDIGPGCILMNCVVDGRVPAATVKTI